VLDASESRAIEGVALRLGLFYGPGVGSTEFMRSLLRRRLMVLPGRGRGIGSWIHVEDGAAAVVAALERAPAGSVYNVVDDEPVSMADFLGEMSRQHGLPRARSIPKWTARLGGRYGGMVASATLIVSNRKVKDELGWQPRYPTYREGLQTLR
jgi:nucleoside-diphosphate-sugar epimerase